MMLRRAASPPVLGSGYYGGAASLLRARVATSQRVYLLLLPRQSRCRVTGRHVAKRTGAAAAEGFEWILRYGRRCCLKPRCWPPPLLITPPSCWKRRQEHQNWRHYPLVAGNGWHDGWQYRASSRRRVVIFTPLRSQAFDAGNLYIADEYTKAEAVLVVNTNATGSTTVTGVTIPAGQIVKIAGSPTGGGSTCPNYASSSAPGGCTFGSYTNGAVANASQVDGPWAVATDPAGNVYVANEFNDNGFKITSAGIISTYGGIQGFRSPRSFSVGRRAPSAWAAPSA